MNNLLLDTLKTKLDILKKNQILREEKILKEEKDEENKIKKLKYEIDDIENEVVGLNKELDKINIASDKYKNVDLIEEEYKKNSKILVNNETIKELLSDINEINKNIKILDTLYSKKINTIEEKRNFELTILESIQNEKNNEKNLLDDKFENIKNEKTLKYNNLIEIKNNLEGKIKDLKEKQYYHKEKNLEVRNKNIFNIINYKKELINLKKKDKAFKKKINDTNLDLENFEKNVYLLKKEKILLELRNDLDKNEEKLNSNIIDKKIFFLNNSDINLKFEKHIQQLDNQLNKIKNFKSKLDIEYNKFLIFQKIKIKSYSNKIEIGDNYYELIKKYKYSLDQINMDLSEYNIITSNIENFKTEELKQLNEDFAIKYQNQNVKYLNQEKIIQNLIDEKICKINNLDNEIKSINQKIDNLNHNNNSLKLNYELNINNFITHSEKNTEKQKNIKNEINSKENTLSIKKRLITNLEDKFKNNKLKREAENNQLLIEELLEIQEINKKINELQQI